MHYRDRDKHKINAIIYRFRKDFRSSPANRNTGSDLRNPRIVRQSMGETDSGPLRMGESGRKKNNGSSKKHVV